MTGFVAALIACFVPLEALANLISLGTLMVFTFVDAGVILLRLGNAAELSPQDPEDRADELKTDMVKDQQKRVIKLLIVFTLSVLGASLTLSNGLGSSTRLPLLVFASVASLCGILICYTPASWTKKYTDTATSTYLRSTHFECPCFPAIPVSHSINIGNSSISGRTR